MAQPKPTELMVEQTVRFLESALPRPPCRVLEVGCGSGAVAAWLKAKGFAVTGIDASDEAAADCRARGVDAVAGDFLSFRAEPFDAIVFTRSLHHLESPARAADRAHALLRPGGTLIAEEFAVERMDQETARWFYETLSLLEAAGMIAADPGSVPLASSPLDRWFHEHEGDPPLHTSEDMLVALGTRFDLERVATAPYLYRYFCERVEPTDRGARLAHWVFELESMRIAEMTLRAIGLRLVARRGAL